MDLQQKYFSSIICFFKFIDFKKNYILYIFCVLYSKNFNV
ncbi:hypothetical protein M8044_000080 [Columbia Basin potato purple top phytoplasma]|uniref:Uncharacterized protein n=1 Tax=Columbia Basin potato purple top phytoplasma TaxID=307134 RepID=A0ABT5L9G8_9MOLU|nr:hypothetical protein [Columbia Basin potato purple top phytoplasma]